MSVGADQGFGLYANSCSRAAVTRSLATPMKASDVFRFRMDNNNVDANGEVGIELRDANGAVRFRFFFVGGQATYRVIDAAGDRPTTTAWTDGGLQLALSLSEEGAYTLSTGSGEFSGTLADGLAIQWIEFFNDNSGPGDGSNFYIGEMSHEVASVGSRTVTTSASVTRSGTAYGDWLGEEVSSDAMLLKYAIGGSASPGEEGQDPQMSNDSGDFVLTAVIREDDALNVAGKTTDNLSGGWTTDGVRAVEPADQSAAPPGCKIVEYRVSADADHRFLRLEVTHTP